VRVLLLHPEDSPERGPWASQRWDRIIDAGIAGPNTYQRWSEKFCCPAEPLGLPGLEDFLLVRDTVASGLGRLLDDEGLDWWELNAILLYKEMETVSVLRRFAASLGKGDELFATRPCFHAEALRFLAPNPPQCFHTNPAARKGLGHYVRVARKFPLGQLAEIFWDKYDATYNFRTRFVSKPNLTGKPVVLLPSSYVNVSRVGLAYASILPRADFLLITTRRSGWVQSVPQNVRVGKLVSYASPRKATAKELSKLIERWHRLRKELESVPEIALLGRLGFLDSFPEDFRRGLGVRDAWREVLDRENVRALLCGDDTNQSTRTPLLLARKRGIPSFICHHGALDGRHLLRAQPAAPIFAKGRMEEDYLLGFCRVPASEIEVGAPAKSPVPSENQARGLPRDPSAIVFFSEFYEVSGGRAEEFYRDLIAPLAELALKTGRKFIVKLHPFEPLWERERLVAKLLAADRRSAVQVVSGALTEEFFARTWFGVTVLSTVASECALRGIPCFLCKWLEFWPYRYIEQYGKFGAGRVLNSAAEIATIPQLLENYSITPETKAGLWQSISPSRFEELLESGVTRDGVVAAGKER